MAKTLKQLRAERLLTVRRHAALANVSTSTLMDVEHGRVCPHFATMQAVAGALGVEVREVSEFARALDSKMSEAA